MFPPRHATCVLGLVAMDALPTTPMLVCLTPVCTLLASVSLLYFTSTTHQILVYEVDNSNYCSICDDSILCEEWA